jgi:hypothetical protein
MTIADRLRADRQFLILDYLREFPLARRRHAGPRDIAEHFRLTPEAVRAGLLDLRAKGWVELWGRNELAEKMPTLGEVS